MHGGWGKSFFFFWNSQSWKLDPRRIWTCQACGWTALLPGSWTLSLRTDALPEPVFRLQTLRKMPWRSADCWLSLICSLTFAEASYKVLAPTVKTCLLQTCSPGSLWWSTHMPHTPYISSPWEMATESFKPAEETNLGACRHSNIEHRWTWCCAHN